MPLGVRQFLDLVQDLRVHGELADVVEKGRPAEPVTISQREAQLVGDHVRKSPDAFRVPTRLSIVAAERGCKRQDLLGHGRRHLLVGVQPLARAAFELPGCTRPPRDPQALRGLVGEKHGHLQQGGQREKAPTETLRPDEGNRRRAEHRYPPKRLSEHSVSAGDLAAHGHGCRDRYSEGCRNRGSRQDRAQHAVRPPTLRLDHSALRCRVGHNSRHLDLTVARLRDLMLRQTWPPAS